MRKAAATFVLVLAMAFGAGLGLARAEPPTTHEIIYTRPSGFWTSNRPAVGGAYRWRLLGIGCGIALLTGALMLRAVRKASAERAGRQIGQWPSTKPPATPPAATASPAPTAPRESSTSASADRADPPPP